MIRPASLVISCLAFILTGCPFFWNGSNDTASEDTPMQGTGEIDVYRVDSTNGRLQSLYSETKDPVERDRYISLVLHSAYLVDLPEVFGDREYRVALTVTSGKKQATRLLEGVFEPPGRLNFRDFALLSDLVYTGKPINITMDIIELDEGSKEQWKQYIDMTGGILGIASKTFLPGGDTITQIAKSIIDATVKDDPNQFPFNLTLHEADAATLNTVSPLLDSKYVFSALRTKQEPQIWETTKFTQKVSLNSGKLYNDKKEFRARSYLIVTVRARDKRQSYSDEDFASHYRKAIGFRSQINDWDRDKRLLERAFAALDDAQEELTKSYGAVTQRDIDARTYFYKTERLLWLAASVPCDSKAKNPRCREDTGVYFRQAFDSFLRIPKNAFPADDISASRYSRVKNYLCENEVKRFLSQIEWNDRAPKLCVGTSKKKNYIYFASRHVFPPLEQVDPYDEHSSDDGGGASSYWRSNEGLSKKERRDYTPRYRRKEDSERFQDKRDRDFGIEEQQKEGKEGK